MPLYCCILIILICCFCCSAFFVISKFLSYILNNKLKTQLLIIPQRITANAKITTTKSQNHHELIIKPSTTTKKTKCNIWTPRTPIHPNTKKKGARISSTRKTNCCPNRRGGCGSRGAFTTITLPPPCWHCSPCRPAKDGHSKLICPYTTWIYP